MRGALGGEDLSPTRREALLVANPRFRRLVMAVAISSAGDPITLTISLFILYSRTGSPFSVAGAYLSQIAAALVIGALLGALTDRVARRPLIVRLELVRTLVIASLPLVVTVTPFALYPALFVTGAIEAIVQPARQASIPELVGVDHVASANSAVLACFSVAQAVGFAVAGGLLTVLHDARWGYLLDASTFAAAAFLVAGIGNLGGGVKTVRLSTGFRKAIRIASVRPYLAVAAGVTIATSMLPPALVPLSYRLSANGPLAYSVLQTCLVIGLLAGSLRAGRIPARRNMTAMLLALALFALAHVAIGLSPTLLLAGLSFGLAAIGNVVYSIMQQSGLMRAADSDNRGAVMSARFSVVQGARVFGLGLGAAVVGVIGPGPTFVMNGIWLMLLTVAAAAWLARDLGSAASV